MSRSRRTEAQMIGALKQLEAGRKAEGVVREVGVGGAGFSLREFVRAGSIYAATKTHRLKPAPLVQRRGRRQRI
jgi:hypothetical protein